MLLAAAASISLVMVVVTSIKVARKRLRYESWHLLHLYAYLGVGLALPHQLWTGQQFTDSASRTVFWWSAWAATAGIVVACRIGEPIRLNLRHRLRVASVTDEGSQTWSVTLTGRKLELLRVEAGQFFGWRFLNGPGWTRSNPYSLSAAPDGTSLRITVQAVGDGSAAVRDLKAGTRAIIEGPFGRLSHRPRTKERITFIGAGVGITPLRALAEGLDYRSGDAVYLERFSNEPLFPTETDQLAAARGLRLLRVGGSRRTPDSWLGPSAGTTDDLTSLLTWIPDIAYHDVYICGPAPWTALVLNTLATAGVPDSQIHLETFEW
jgi:ferredoxin-NADP reductase